jgi:hypothetical protein
MELAEVTIRRNELETRTLEAKAVQEQNSRWWKNKLVLDKIIVSNCDFTKATLWSFYKITVPP